MSTTRRRTDNAREGGRDGARDGARDDARDDVPTGEPATADEEVLVDEDYYEEIVVLDLRPPELRDRW